MKMKPFPIVWKAYKYYHCLYEDDILFKSLVCLSQNKSSLTEPSVPSDKDVISAIKVLKLYAIHNPSIPGSIIRTESVVYGHIVENRCHMSQKCLTGFFKV